MSLPIPYIFATRYGGQRKMPADHAAAPIVQRPYAAATRERAIVDLLG
ncbi:hypothetical protein [uncultured Sphingomonas sp.]